MVLESINSLRKLCNHPSLVITNGKATKGFEEVRAYVLNKYSRAPGTQPEE